MKISLTCSFSFWGWEKEHNQWNCQHNFFFINLPGWFFSQPDWIQLRLGLWVGGIITFISPNPIQKNNSKTGRVNKDTTCGFRKCGWKRTLIVTEIEMTRVTEVLRSRGRKHKSFVQTQKHLHYTLRASKKSPRSVIKTFWDLRKSILGKNFGVFE